MQNLFERNGLIFWNEQEIHLRRMHVGFLVCFISKTLKELNRAFEIIEVEAPILQPVEYVHPSYTEDAQ